MFGGQGTMYRRLGIFVVLLFVAGVLVGRYGSEVLDNVGQRGGSLHMSADSVWVPMRDGVKLYTEIYKPGEGQYPVVLTRGYWPGKERDARKFTEAGYIYVGQSTRGHGRSEGDKGVQTRFFDDKDDGYDTLTWISEQPWSDGNIAMYGKSYWAATQWLVATEGHPNLRAIIPQNMNADMWQCVYWCNGALTLAMAAHGRAYNNSSIPSIDEIGWDRFYRHLPLITLDRFSGEEHTEDAKKLWQDYLSHDTFDDYWSAISLRGDGKDGKYAGINVPVYLMGGWYDYYAGAAFTSFQQLKAARAENEIRVVINPADHVNRVVGDRQFGKKATKDEVELAIRWLDAVVKGIDNGISEEAPIRIFVMGANEWRYENEWPLARTVFTNYFFHSPDGQPKGSLSTERPQDQVPTVYSYDPNDPVPTLGGNHSFSSDHIPEIIRAGAVDQRPLEDREDVLVYTSEPLANDTEVTGPVTITLYAASSATDTDFTAKLIDVYPDGTAYNLTEGIIRARFRESVWETPSPIIPGEIYTYTLELLPTSNVFKRGHRIRVHLSSSNFPLWDRNLNTGKNPTTGTEMQIAEQTIYHDAKYPSHITLPIIPQDD